MLAGFAARVFKPPVDLLDARWASEQSGTMTTLVPRVSGNGGSVADVHLELRPRPVLLPEEVRLGPEHPFYGRAATVFLPDVHVFQAWFCPAFEEPSTRAAVLAAQAAPPQRALRCGQPRWVSKAFASEASPEGDGKRTRPCSRALQVHQTRLRLPRKDLRSRQHVFAKRFLVRSPADVAVSSLAKRTQWCWTERSSRRSAELAAETSRELVDRTYPPCLLARSGCCG